MNAKQAMRMAQKIAQQEAEHAEKEKAFEKLLLEENQKRAGLPKETVVWLHYRDYLTEATLKTNEDVCPDLVRMRKRIYEGCARTELRDMMVQVFDPGTVMQGLEQWQCMMDLLLYTRIRRYGVKSRVEFYKNASPYDMTDGVLDDAAPLTHIYNLSSTTQDLAHMVSEFAPGKSNAPGLLEEIILQAGLQRNAELQMLRGDLYRQMGEFEKAKRIYREIREKGLANDRSIEDAVRHTDQIKVIRYGKNLAY